MSFETAFPISLLHLKLGSGSILTEPLFVSTFSRLANTTEITTEALRRLLQDYFEKLTPGELIRHRRGSAASAKSFSLVIEPPRASSAWREPIQLTFHAAIWNHVGGYALARVPVLGIEVIASEKEDLEDILRKESLIALRRLNATTSLKSLAKMQSVSAFKIDSIDVVTKLHSLKERAIKSNTEPETKKTTLETVSWRMHSHRQEPAFEIEETVRRLADALTAKPAQSVLLIGPSGVGKTAAIRELVRRKSDFDLGPTPFFQTSGSRIVAGQCGFGMWEQRCQDLVKDAAKIRAIVSLGHLIELLNVGKSEYNATGLGSFLRSYIARGELLCIAECTPEQVQAIEKQDPQSLDAFRQLTLEEPDSNLSRKILTRFAQTKSTPLPTSEVLAVIDRLHRRFATYSANPGRPLRFLDNLLRDCDPSSALQEGDIYEAFTRETGLPRPMIDPAVPLDVQIMREWFASHVIGQTEAVELVTDLLATVKAGLSQPNRPIASLLFIGPTGVGKTEMAKALAEYLFGSRDRLTRFDMSEFADPVSVRRLVGGAFGSEGLLTARVREEPFSVILFDEVEKADPSMFDLLLQALGEARLTDAGGRLADFRNTVIVLTSNLGAESFRAGQVGFAGTSGGTGDAKGHFTKAVESFLRPEMVNRLDRIVPFAPLGREIIQRIAAREWQKVKARDGVRFRNLTLSCDAGLIDHIASVGFDARYGARPLQRAMERELLAPLAKQMNRYTGDVPLAVEVGIDRRKPNISVKPAQGKKSYSQAEVGQVRQLAEQTQDQRRWYQLLAQCSFVRDVENELTQLQLQEQRIVKKQYWKENLSREDMRILAELGKLRELSTAIQSRRNEAEALADEAIFALHHIESENAALFSRFSTAKKEWDELLLMLYSRKFPESTTVAIAMFSESPTRLMELAETYRDIAAAMGVRVVAATYCLPQSPATVPSSTAPSEAVDAKVKTYWHDDRLVSKGPPIEVVMDRHWKIVKRPGLLGIGLSFSGKAAHLHFCAEAGIHQFPKTNVADKESPKVWVRLLTEQLKAYCPDPALTRQGSIPDERPLRVYSVTSVTDKTFAEPFLNLWPPFIDQLKFVIKAGVRRRLASIVLE